MHCVEEKLKKRQNIYQISRTEAEVRISDYNPLLLLLWKANMDIQFVSEYSLALAHYVSGYVTKAERSNMSEIWLEVSESKTIYGRLWSSCCVQGSVAFTRLVIYCLEITFLKSLMLCSGYASQTKSEVEGPQRTP